MATSSPQPHRPVAPLQVVLATRDAHDRQRELVRASLMACPGAARATHRRWA